MSILSRWKRSARGQHIRREKLIARLSEEVRLNGPESGLAKWITAEIQEIDAPPAKKVAPSTSSRQRVRERLRDNWQAAFQAPSDRHSKTPRKERRMRARAEAAGQYKKEFAKAAAVRPLKKRQDRRGETPGRGGYWTVTIETGPSYECVRK